MTGVNWVKFQTDISQLHSKQLFSGIRIRNANIFFEKLKLHSVHTILTMEKWPWFELPFKRGNRIVKDYNGSEFRKWPSAVLTGFSYRKMYGRFAGTKKAVITRCGVLKAGFRGCGTTCSMSRAQWGPYKTTFKGQYSSVLLEQVRLVSIKVGHVSKIKKRTLGA